MANAFIFCTLYYLFLIFICSNSVTCNIKKPKSGPYIVTLTKSGPCENNKTGRPYEKEHSIEFYCEIYNTTEKSNLMRGYAAVLKDNVVLTINLKTFYLLNGRRQLVFQLINIRCRSIIVNTFAKIFGIQFDKKTCAMQKGNYTFQNIDYNVIDHFRMSTREYGEMVYRAEVFSRGLTAFCWESLAVLKPSTASKKT